MGEFEILGFELNVVCCACGAEGLGRAQNRHLGE